MHIFKKIYIYFFSPGSQKGNLQGTPDTLKYTKIPSNPKAGFLFAPGGVVNNPVRTLDSTFTTLNKACLFRPLGEPYSGSAETWGGRARDILRSLWESPNKWLIQNCEA